MNKSGYISIVGWPNAGKSSLLNALLGHKLAIVGPKPQTTRAPLTGIYNEQGVQLILLDTPGWLEPKDVLQSSMKKSILRAVNEDSDVILWVLDVHHWTSRELEWFEILKSTNRPIIVAVNKVDSDQETERFESLKNKLLEVVALRYPQDAFLSIFPVSAKNKRGVGDLRTHLLGLLPEGEPYFPIDQITNIYERAFVMELVRENILRMFHDEVPHASAVLLDEFVEKTGHKDVIRATIYVETEGQKRILVGEKGRKIRDLGTASRKDIESHLMRPVFLELRVKVRKDWRKDPKFVASLNSYDN